MKSVELSSWTQLTAYAGVFVFWCLFSSSLVTAQEEQWHRGKGSHQALMLLLKGLKLRIPRKEGRPFPPGAGTAQSLASLTANHTSDSIRKIV